MPASSYELELLGVIFTTLSSAVAAGDLVGLTPAGEAIAPGVFNQVTQDAPYPYVRITLTDSRLIDDEPMDYNTVPEAKRLMVMVDAFSEYEPCTFQLASQLQALLQHLEITTAHLHGSTWLQSSDYFSDNITYPDRVVRRATLRIAANLDLVA